MPQHLFRFLSLIYECAFFGDAAVRGVSSDDDIIMDDDEI